METILRAVGGAHMPRMGKGEEPQVLSWGDTRVENEHIKNAQVQIKTILRSRDTAMKMAFKKKENQRRQLKCQGREQVEVSPIARGNTKRNSTSILEELWKSLIKLNTHLPHDPAVPVCDLLGKNTHRCLQEALYADVDSDFT